MCDILFFFFFFSSRRRHTRSLRDWSSDVCSSNLIFVGPACNAALFGYQAAITPDHLQGRVLSVIFLFAMSAATAAPLLAGVFVTAWSAPVSIALFAAAVSVSAVTASVAPAIRDMKPIETITP